MADYFLSDLVEATALVNTDLLHLRTVGNIDKKIQFLNLVKTFRDILNKNADYVIVDTDRNPIILVDSTSGNVTITLPTLVANQNKMIWIVKLVAVNNVIVDGEGAETINGIATYTLVKQYEVLKVIGVSTTWNIDGKSTIRAADIDFGIVAGDVDADVLPLGTAVTSSPTGGTATNLANTSFVRAAIQESFNRLIDLSGVENAAAKARHIDFSVNAGDVDADILPLGTIVSSSPTGGTATNLAAATFVRAALQEILNRLIDLSGVENGAIDPRHLATDAVETEKIKARNVTFPKMVTGVLDTYLKAQGADIDSIYEKLALKDTGIRINQGSKTGTGDLVISDVGFQPSVVIFIATQQTGDHVESSWGFDDGTRHYVIYSSSSGNKYPNISFAIYIISSTGNYHTAKITSLASNGFTLTWYQVGIEASTGFIYLCLP